MEEKKHVLNTLLTLVNVSPSETNDTIIARAIIENRYVIAGMSMDDLARKYHVSQPTISRFVKKIGFSSFSELKSIMALSDYVIRDAAKDKPINDPAEGIREVHDDVQKAVDEIMKIDPLEILEVAGMLKEADQIVFMGSELSMSIIRILQHKLLSMGKSIYTILLPSYQNEILESLEGRTLLVCISTAGRWILSLNDEKLQKCGCRKILLSGHDFDYRRKGFDRMYRFSLMGNNLSYNSLMTYVMALNRMLY